MLKQIRTESLLHQVVVCEGNTLLPHPAMATFVDELTHRLQVRVAWEKQYEGLIEKNRRCV